MDDPVPLHRLDVPAPHVLSFAVGSFDTIGPLSRASFPHRHTFYEIVYVTGGEGTHVIDLARWPLCPPHLCVIVPGQVHYWDGVRGLCGQVVLFTEDFLVAHPADRHALATLAERPWLCPGPAEAVRLSALMGEMVREFAERAEGHVSVLQAYAHILLTCALRLPGARRPQVPTSRSALVAREFTRLLGRPAAFGRTVGSYADELGVSLSYLTEAVKRGTGRTPGQIIRHAQTVEAKRLLTVTRLTVAQVARRTGFGDPAYFCRFFRRETGLSPGDFRRRTGGIHHDPGGESIEDRARPS
ncbi:helix-turn-helix domain-containing protein [Streptomyces sp. MST-110588]|uniref:helix-turn-helix domain-containing protein n=1 Tax=Streptomyces sp. MST-110588 TaxID=2833628 RepID=UPI001F5CFC26|nr:helix-turn-helix domain-containing protein [Streptomyces sp. MST-110588]